MAKQVSICLQFESWEYGTQIPYCHTECDRVTAYAHTRQKRGKKNNNGIGRWECNYCVEIDK